MTAPAALFAALGAPAVDVRFVGGCVRNWLMKRPITDFDLATPEPPDVVMQRLEKAGLRAIPTGIAHGTVTAVLGDETYEITSLRRDTACDGRHAAVEFTTDWAEDARRRDFTINAMSLRPDGALFDYHDGLDDAKAGRVRFVGDPADRIQEDYLRILRLFRFFAWYGRVALDAPTLGAVKRLKDGLVRLSVERITQEIAKLLAAPDPVPAVTLMTGAGVLADVLAGADPVHLEALVSAENESAVAPDWLRRLAVMLPVDARAQGLVLSNKEADRLAQLTAATPALSPATPEGTWNRALYELGSAVVIDRLLLAWARDGRDAFAWRTCIAAARRWTPVTFPVSGADVLALGIAPGPLVGTLLRKLEDWWIHAAFKPARPALLEELARLAKG
jgi:poly(A) polymerase